MRILLVEDDLKIASFIIKGLKAAGFAVDHASDGEEGLHLALSEPYDTAIIDIMLPKRDGLSLIEEMRREKTKQLAIRIGEHARRANAHIMKLTSALINAGESEIIFTSNTTAEYQATSRHWYQRCSHLCTRPGGTWSHHR